jgi:hypothetical protein
MAVRYVLTVLDGDVRVIVEVVNKGRQMRLAGRLRDLLWRGVSAVLACILKRLRHGPEVAL